MMFYDEYSDVPAEAVEAFIASQPLGRLVTSRAGEPPHLGLYPFVHRDDQIEIHLNRSDEQLRDLETSGACTFELDEVLATIPSHWIDPHDAIFATAYHRAVIFDCSATVVADLGEVAAQQTRLMARYQPEGGFAPISSADPIYARSLPRIAGVKLQIKRRRVKFKLAQNRPPETRREVARRLRARNRPGDLRAAEALESTLQRAR